MNTTGLSDHNSPLLSPRPAADSVLNAGDATIDAASHHHCTNCGAELQGAFCHLCGQPTRHFIRFFPVVVRELTEDTLGVDGRFWRTFVALLFRPGRLTLDYLHGRRIFYSPPIRLYLLTSLVAFLVFTTVVDSALDSTTGGVIVTGNDEQTREEVLDELREQGIVVGGDGSVRVLDQQGDTIATVKDAAITPGETIDAAEQNATGAGDETETSQVAADDAAAESIRPESIRSEASPELEGLPPTPGLPAMPKSPTPRPPEVDPEDDVMADDDSDFIVFGSEPWDAEENPLILPFFTEGMNRRLNVEIGEFEERMPEIRKNPRILVDEILEILPQTMFLLLPAFALILKFYYMFSRRYYMEHLLFALHNHAFVFALMTLMVLVDWLGEWMGGGNETWWSDSLILAGQFWLFVYLFLAQKRVYGQGWIMTSLKYMMVGFSYLILSMFALVGASLVGVLLV